MSDTPKVSVIVPAHNRSETIGRSIQSVLGQTYEPFEVIVVDDGSTDDTINTVGGFPDARIRLFRHTNNRGAAAARNTGLMAARGEYLAFLDSDDEWLPDKLSEQIRLLESLPREWGLCCSGYYLLTNAHAPIIINKPPRHLVRHLYGACGLSPGSTLLMRRGCLKDVGFLDERFPRLEDWDWLLRLAKSYKMAYLERPLARIYQNSQPSAQVIEKAVRLFLIKHDAGLRSFGPFYRRRTVARHLLRLAYYFYLEREIARGSQYFIKALIENPLQNPFRLIAILHSSCDALTGRTVTRRAINLKRKFLRR